jgi:hypothetical protein
LWRHSVHQVTPIEDAEPAIDQSMAAETTGRSMSALDRLLGAWDVTMHHSQMSEPVTGRQRYERVLDGAFVLLHWEQDHPEFPDAIAVMSEDRYHHFDVRGVIRIFDFEINDAGWSMVHLDKEFSQRIAARFNGPDEMESTGEGSDDQGATWQHDFMMTYRRVSRQ